MRRKAAILTIFALLLWLLAKQYPQKLGGLRPENSGETAVPETKDEEVASGELTDTEKSAARATEAVFFGRVVDQFGQGVALVDVEYVRNREKSGSAHLAAWTKTDSQGCFEIREAKTQSLAIVAVPPAGYYPTEGTSQSFAFSQVPESLPDELKKRAIPPHKADRSKPILFFLRGMGTTLPMVYAEKSGVIGEDNIFKIDNAGRDLLMVKFSFDPEVIGVSDEGRRKLYRWGVDLSVKGGEVIERADVESQNAEAFIAPEAGYIPTLSYRYGEATSSGENPRVFSKEFFFRTSEGKFGRASVSITPDFKRKVRHFGVVESWLEPSGTRYTEFNPAKQITAGAR